MSEKPKIDENTLMALIQRLGQKYQATAIMVQELQDNLNQTLGAAIQIINEKNQKIKELEDKKAKKE